MVGNRRVEEALAEHRRYSAKYLSNGALRRLSDQLTQRLASNEPVLKLTQGRIGWGDGSITGRRGLLCLAPTRLLWVTERPEPQHLPEWALDAVWAEAVTAEAEPQHGPIKPASLIQLRSLSQIDAATFGPYYKNYRVGPVAQDFVSWIRDAQRALLPDG